MAILTIENIEEAIHKLDLLQRPYVAYLNPEDAEAIKAVLPRVEEEIVIIPTPLIEKGKGIAIKRDDIESWARIHFDDSNKSL